MTQIFFWNTNLTAISHLLVWQLPLIIISYLIILELIINSYMKISICCHRSSILLSITQIKISLFNIFIYFSQAIHICHVYSHHHKQPVFSWEFQLEGLFNSQKFSKVELIKGHWQILHEGSQPFLLATSRQVKWKNRC